MPRGFRLMDAPRRTRAVNHSRSFGRADARPQKRAAAAARASADSPRSNWSFLYLCIISAATMHSI